MKTSPDIVVYVHGLWMGGGESLLLRRRLAAAGLAPHPFRYPTTSASMGEITERLAAFVRDLSAPRVHFVGHSLGGLILYRFFERYPHQPPGRVVFLGTPAVRSLTAVAIARRKWLAALVGSAVAEELFEERTRRWCVERDLGILAGTRRIGLGRFLAHFEEDCDGTVGVSETRLAGATDHRTLPVSHMGMLLSPRVAREVAQFLDRGRFSSDDG